MGLVKTLIDSTFKTNNTWLGFHNDIPNLFTILRKNLDLSQACIRHVTPPLWICKSAPEISFSSIDDFNIFLNKLWRAFCVQYLTLNVRALGYL